VVFSSFGPKASRLGRFIGAISESMNTEADLTQVIFVTIA
jgi:hypothetical protein